MLWENKLYQEDLGETYEYLKSILGERKSILVTGVTGLIGSYLIDLLVYYNRNSNRKKYKNDFHIFVKTMMYILFIKT